MFSCKSMPGLSLLFTLLFCLACPFVTFVEAAAGDLETTTVDSDFITIFGEAMNTPKAANTSSVSNIPKAAEPVAEIEEQVSVLKVMPENKRFSKNMKMAGPFLRIANSLDAIVIIAIFVFLFTMSNFSLAAFSFKSTKDDHKHYCLINSQVRNHKWLTLIAGLLNGGVITFVTLLLIKKMPLIGLFLLAWGIGVILQIMAASILSGTESLNDENYNGQDSDSDSDEESSEEEVNKSTNVLSYLNVLKRTLCQLLVYLIPVYGQLEFLKTIIRGIGAKVLLKTGFGRKTESAD